MSQQSITETRGKHQILAELKRAEQETGFVKHELQMLPQTENTSVACKEMLGFVESKPDPLLPSTVAPVEPAWDRWFEGTPGSKRCPCSIL